MHPLPVVAALAACLSACLVGEPPPAGGRGEAPDAAIGGGPDPDPNCLPSITGGGGDGHHNAGLGCNGGGCHGLPLGIGAPEFSIAGTLYTSAAGQIGVDGATIRVTDANGTTIDLTTRGLGGTGNFYSTDLALTPPFTVQATACPSFKQMGSPAPTGNCNSCHVPGGMANARIHL